MRLELLSLASILKQVEQLCDLSPRLHSLRITELATEITQTIQQAVETIPSFSSQGSSYDRTC
ncbi:hypothetical protein V9Z70_07725 [Streptococcus suis]|uniref:hypothetical protein n=1 Tax=Streptococcus suis TaxID=1307 RepID=UPI0030103E64